MFDDEIELYRSMTDDELIEMLFEGTVVDTMALAVLVKRLHKKVKD